MKKPEKPSELTFYVNLAIHLIRDTADKCNSEPSIRSLERDIVTLRSRAESEGIAFFTKALPSLGKCLDKALSSDLPVSYEGTSFGLSKKYRHPVFLGSLWRLVFDSDGVILSDLNCKKLHFQIQAVRAIRQICFLLYKLEGSCSEKEDSICLDNFVEVDATLPAANDEVSLSASTRRALDSAAILIHYVLQGFNPADIRPKHGPGAVATGEKQWEKKNFSRLYVALEEYYPFSDYFFMNYSHLCYDMETLDNLEVVDEAEALIALVPKDSRGPRVISMEPLELQWIQQGVMTALVPFMERAGSPCAGHLNFSDQSINGALALRNSYNGMFNTYDMKEASDRVSTWLVKELLPHDIFDHFMACRSVKTVLPDGRCVVLNKFAPMGSALCFPVEALIFWALAVGSNRDIYSVRHLDDLPDVYVYGDDIIASKKHYDKFSTVFEELFLQFNEDKCCTGRFFRESCGIDAFKLMNVNPVRIRKRWNNSLSPAATLAYIAYVNSYRARGYHQTADYLQKMITKVFGSIPYTNRRDLTGYFYFMYGTADDVVKRNRALFKTRFNADYQRDEVRVPQSFAPQIKRGDPDWAEWFRRISSEGGPKPFSFVPEETSEPCSYTVPRRIKSRWVWVGLLNLTQ